MTFDGLTGPATAAHIHVAPRGQPGPVVVPLCGRARAPASGTASVDATVLAAIQTGGAYVNVHTDRNRAGEIRGQVGITAPLSTALGSRQEVPKPKGNVRRATGSFVATVAKGGDDRRRHLAPHVRPADRAGRRGAHPHGPRRTGRPRRGRALRPVPERPARKRRRERGDARCPRGGTRLREHPHEAEPGRRDPGQLPAAALRIG